MLVLDTNVLVSALASRTGASNWLVDGVLAGKVNAAISVALVLEYESVLKRQAVRDLTRQASEDVDALLDALIAQTFHVAPIDVAIRPSANDPGDDMLIECAMTAKADAIVTMNLRDLTSAAKRHELVLMTPAEAVIDLKKKGVNW